MRCLCNSWSGAPADNCPEHGQPVKPVPPYWPYRCATCKRFVSNPRVEHNAERITDERGDCSRCGPNVKLVGLSWEEWFPEDYYPFEAIFGRPS
jgi:hypothetical protein